VDLLQWLHTADMGGPVAVLQLRRWFTCRRTPASCNALQHNMLRQWKPYISPPDKPLRNLVLVPCIAFCNKSIDVKINL